MKWYLDFGHGGKDSGSLGTNKTKESDTVLKIGMLIKNNLEQAFEKLITTREDDKYYSLDYRSSKANKENCDYFVSIHMSSATNKSAKGVEVWAYDEKSKLYTLSISESEIKAAMDLVIAKNIFAPNGDDIVKAVDAKVVVTDTTPYDLVL